MARGPFAFAVLVLVALSATASSAFAGEPPPGPEWCVRVDTPELSSGAERTGTDRSEKLSEHVLSDDVISFAAPAPARPLAPGPDSLLCVRGGVGPDCQVQDPAHHPTSPSWSFFAAPDLLLTLSLELPEPEPIAAARYFTAFGAPRAGFVRGLFRPPRV